MKNWVFYTITILLIGITIVKVVVVVLQFRLKQKIYKDWLGRN